MKTDEYIPFDARVLHDGRVDVLIEGEPVEGGQGLAMEAVLRMLAGFARTNGTLLMSTQMPDGRVTRELVTGTGEVLPYYPPEAFQPDGGTAAQEDTSEQFYESLRRRNQPGVRPQHQRQSPFAANQRPAQARKPAQPDTADDDFDLFAGRTSPSAPAPSQTFNTAAPGTPGGPAQKLSVHDVPEFDVEGDVQEALAGQKSKGGSGTLKLLLIIVVVIAVLVGAAVLLFSGSGPVAGMVSQGLPVPSGIGNWPPPNLG